MTKAGSVSSFEHSPTVSNLDEDVLALRLPLDCAPGHVNCYFIRGDDGWTIIDPGMFDEQTCQILLDRIEQLPAPTRLSQVIATHWHPDHLGAAGWLCEKFDIPLLMSEREYLQARANRYLPRSVEDKTEREFLRLHGLDSKQTESWVSHGRFYIRNTYDLPRRFCSLEDGDTLCVGSRRFDVTICPGHSSAAVVLFDKTGGLLICGDHVSAKGAPNIEVLANQPHANPLERYFRSLEKLKRKQIGDSLVLPGHGPAFRGIDGRCDAITSSHLARCNRLTAACRESERTAAEMLVAVYGTYPSPTWIGFQLAQIVAYANFMEATGNIRSVGRDGMIRFVAADIREICEEHTSSEDASL
jgi:glyoxylase-like metal-dependent hydrolase (beta-lactamase superfamily II)